MTAHPTACWTAQQMVEAFPWETTARYLIRDRDRIYGTDFHRRVKALGLHEVPIAPRSPWQNAYAERFIGSLKRVSALAPRPAVRAERPSADRAGGTASAQSR